MDDPLEHFTRLYDQYYRNVLRYALHHTEPVAAEDVASEAFLIAWRRLDDVPDPPLPWLLGVARNLLRKQVGADHQRRRITEQIAALSTAGDLRSGDPGEQVADREAALRVLASLPERDLETLTLVTWHGLDAAQAAVVVGCSARAFTVRLHRARQRLADAMGSFDQRHAVAVAPNAWLRPQSTSIPGR